MLWYKAWRETRIRFVISALTLVWVCAVIVMFQHQSRFQSDSPMTYAAYVWSAIYKDYVRNLFVVMTIVLGGGSLLQEREHGTAGFTLALPVSRSRLVAVRAAVGIAEVTVLAFVPAIVIPLFSRVVGEPYAAAQAFQFAILWACCGTLVFGLAHLVSTVVSGKYSAWIVCFLTLMLYSAIVNVTALDRIPSLDFFKIMSGARMSYFDSATHVIVGTLPWLPLLATVAAGSGCLAIAACITEARDLG